MIHCVCVCVCVSEREREIDRAFLYRCPYSYMGKRCEIKKEHPCDSYCYNNGTCQLDKHGQPKCTCTDLFGGKWILVKIYYL